MHAIRKLHPGIRDVTLPDVPEAADVEAMERAPAFALSAEGRIGMVSGMEDLEDMTDDVPITDAGFWITVLSRWSKAVRVAMMTDGRGLGGPEQRVASHARMLDRGGLSGALRSAE